MLHLDNIGDSSWGEESDESRHIGVLTSVLGLTTRHFQGRLHKTGAGGAVLVPRASRGIFLIT